jgi:pyridoxal biosynthesis lyase PdxS
MAPAPSGAEVIRAGADYLVIGSPIFRAPEPARAVQSIIDEIERGLRAPTHNPRDGLLTRLPF